MLGLAEWLRRTGGRRGWRWLAASPLAFAAVFLSDPLHLGAFFATGIGGGAIGRTPDGDGRWLRDVRARSPAVAGIARPGLPQQHPPLGADGGDLALSRPRGAWVAVYFWSYLAVLAVASSVLCRPETRSHR
jgi:hypothetical protein